MKKNFGLEYDPSGFLGDIDGDHVVDLADAILALKVASGVDTAGENVTVDADVNGDGKIGLEEAIYVLQAVAEL